MTNKIKCIALSFFFLAVAFTGCKKGGTDPVPVPVYNPKTEVVTASNFFKIIRDNNQLLWSDLKSFNYTETPNIAKSDDKYFPGSSGEKSIDQPDAVFIQKTAYRAVSTTQGVYQISGNLKGEKRDYAYLHFKKPSENNVLTTIKVAVTAANNDPEFGFHPMVTLTFARIAAGGRSAVTERVQTLEEYKSLLKGYADWDGHQFVLTH